MKPLWALVLLAGLGAAAGLGPGVFGERRLSSDYDADAAPVAPGISAEDVRVYARQAYTWTKPAGDNVIAAYGDFQLDMGEYRLRSRDAVVWFRRKPFEKRDYYEMEVFLWQEAEVIHPGGTTETGPALMVTLNSFGQLAVDLDSHARQSDEAGSLYQQGERVRSAIDTTPIAGPPTVTSTPADSPPDETADAGTDEAAADGAAGVEPLQLRTPTTQLAALRPPKAPRRIDYSGRELTSEIVEGQRLVVIIGDVRVSQTTGSSEEGLELRADSAVLYIAPEAINQAMPGGLGGNDDNAREETAPTTSPSAADEPTLDGGSKRGAQAARDFVSAAYLEGDVVLSRGTRTIRAARIYYDFEAERALLVDTVMRALAAGRNVPIYVRAEEVRQLSASEYMARRAKISTSEFYTPHVAIGSSRVLLTDETPRNERGEIIGIQAGSYKAYNTTLDVEGVPLLYWPVSRGEFSRDTMAFRGAKFGYASDFGATFETRWYLFNLLGLDPPPGYDATLKLDYFTDRGPGVGIDVDYMRENYYGLLRSNYVHDSGEDDLGPIRGGDPDTDDRGRVLWRHRQFLPKDWQLTLETSYISDDQYLESYDRNEFENGKDQETLLYLLKRKDNWQFSTLFNFRIMDFLSQTEHFPDVKLSLIAEPLGDVANLYSESRVGIVRYRPDDRRVIDGRQRVDNTAETGAVVRGDTRQELTFPLPELGPIKLVPFVAGRAGAWDDDPHSAGYGRLFGSGGLRANMYFERVFEDVESNLFDLHRLRHSIKPDVAVWGAGSTRDSRQITPFDPDVEEIDGFSGTTLGLRQRWQTKRGGAGRWRTVDWITWDVEAGFFTDKRKGDNTHGNFIYARPEDSIASNFLSTQLTYRISDSTVVIYDGVVDLNRGNAGTSSISLNVERDPRLAYFFGWRYIHDTDNNLVGGGFNYRMNDKHTLALRDFYDVEEGRNVSTELTYVRRWPRWYSAITFDVDRTLDDIGISLSFWPEGAPNLGLGSKRYTGLGDSVGLRP